MSALVILFVLLGLALGGLALTLNALVNVFRDRAPYVSTSRWAITWLRDRLRLPPGTVVYDLGCGDGRVLRAIAAANPGVRAIGYERGWFPYLIARLESRGTRVEIRYGNFYRANLGDADVVFCFLIEAVMGRVERLLRSQLKPGAVVYSYGFRFPTWPLAEVIPNPRRPRGSNLNVYRAWPSP